MQHLFDFYLDAWNYCRANHVDLNKIRKLNFRKWIIEH